jgi:hypothetical protein
MAAESAFLHVMISLGMNTMFVGEDLIFCEWCSDYFDYMWQRSSKPVNPRKLKIVEY